jgi:hypothetical protein
VAILALEVPTKPVLRWRAGATVRLVDAAELAAESPGVAVDSPLAVRRVNGGLNGSPRVAIGRENRATDSRLVSEPSWDRTSDPLPKSQKVGRPFRLRADHTLTTALARTVTHWHSSWRETLQIRTDACQ